VRGVGAGARFRRNVRLQPARRGTVVNYNLAHLIQPPSQAVGGPIQDDEALFLFALIRVMRLRRILELGGLDGYSAKNFCEAVSPDGTVFTVDLNPLNPVDTNHIALRKDARDLTPADVGNEPRDLIFFDCHEYDVQWQLYLRLCRSGLLSDKTVLAFHDTNLHPMKILPSCYQVEGGWVHQDAERRMVNKFKRMGYDVFALNTAMTCHDETFPFRHGLTIVTKFTPFLLRPSDTIVRRAASWLKRRIHFSSV
jgi:predicted O-methyltransferase YrrM